MSEQTFIRHLPLRATRRRNGVLIINDETGRVIRIRLQRGNRRDQVRITIRGEAIHVMVEEAANREDDRE